MRRYLLFTNSPIQFAEKYHLTIVVYHSLNMYHLTKMVASIICIIPDKCNFITAPMFYHSPEKYHFAIIVASILYHVLEKYHLTVMVMDEYMLYHSLVKYHLTIMVMVEYMLYHLP